MRCAPSSLMIVWGLFVASSALQAQVRVICERNEGDRATPEFRFRNVPAPSKTDAGGNARFLLIAGEPDPNGGALEQLNDGRMPGEEDEPEANFFFNAGTDGGRLLVDLGHVVDIRQVNTYSWHPGTRGPQVYRLYASDGSAVGFDPRPGRGVDPAKAGWQLIALVDTRPAQGPGGGQYGVSVSGAAGTPIGRYRYLLFDIFRTEDRDRFGNTFFSEIDIDDGKEHAVSVAATMLSSVLVDGQYEIVFDVSETPDLQQWVDTTLKPVCAEWYPVIVKMLPSEGYSAPKRLTVKFRKDMQGVAATSGTRISCAGGWFRRNLQGEAAGAVVHELVHVVQQYGRARSGNRNPGWLVEGIADYIRWFKYEPESKRPRPDPARTRYTDGYRTAGAFLNYITEKHDPDIVRKLNAAMRQGRYTPDLWEQYTGKTVDQLWEEYVKTLQAR